MILKIRDKANHVFAVTAKNTSFAVVPLFSYYAVDCAQRRVSARFDRSAASVFAPRVGLGLSCSSIILDTTDWWPRDRSSLMGRDHRFYYFFILADSESSSKYSLSRPLICTNGAYRGRREIFRPIVIVAWIVSPDKALSNRGLTKITSTKRRAAPKRYRALSLLVISVSLSILSFFHSARTRVT